MWTFILVLSLFSIFVSFQIQFQIQIQIRNSKFKFQLQFQIQIQIWNSNFNFDLRTPLNHTEYLLFPKFRCWCVAVTQCSWAMQTLAAKRGKEGSSGLILAHSLNTDTAATPWNTPTHPHTRRMSDELHSCACNLLVWAQPRRRMTQTVEKCITRQLSSRSPTRAHY